jgi:thiol-disulfide isomerase/thioredoxin
MPQFYLNFNNFAKSVMSQIELSYQILMGEGRKFLADENLINTSRWLEEQRIVCCLPEDAGIRVQLNLEGIDAWMRNKLNELHVDWKPIQPGIYGIALLNKAPAHLIENEQSVFQFHYKSLWIEPCSTLVPHLPQDATIFFADIFCEKINFRQLIERIANNNGIAFVLKWEKGELYLNEHIIVTARSNMRKTIMQILIERQKSNNYYISFEEIADILQEHDEFVIDDIHNQIYKHIHILQKRVMKKGPHIAKLGDFIEIHNRCCRLNPLIWVAD